MHYRFSKVVLCVLSGSSIGNNQGYDVKLISLLLCLSTFIYTTRQYAINEMYIVLFQKIYTPPPKWLHYNKMSALQPTVQFSKSKQWNLFGFNHYPSRIKPVTHFLKFWGLTEPPLLPLKFQSLLCGEYGYFLDAHIIQVIS